MNRVSIRQKNVVFIEDDVPPLRAGTYKLTARQDVPNQNRGTFAAASTFVVAGERFALQPDELQSVFPPNLANGEYDGVLPHVVFNRRTLPWERVLKRKNESYLGYPWLAVLLFNDDDGIIPQPVTAQDLVPAGTPITVSGSTVTSSGTLAVTTLSYGADTLVPMDYGESPSDPCTVIDIPIATFNRVAPATVDVQYLAHIREVDSTDGVDGDTSVKQHSVVVGNRIPPINTKSHAFLVSLENFADYLPAADGTQSSHIESTITTIRLIVYRYWTFTANNLDQTLEKLLENLNTPAIGQRVLTTLRLPIMGSAPSPGRVNQALVNQAAGNITGDDAMVLVQNALTMGYVPLNHHLRHGGKTVSWYRGPFVPYPVATTIQIPSGGPDAANNYNPETGLFDVSYGMAWQLGQLLALQNNGMANRLYQWKQHVKQQQVIQQEQAILRNLLLGENLFESFLGPRTAALSADPLPLPDDVAAWFTRLTKLQGVPFNYLVPDENLLPIESLRFFYLDFNWVDALIDGAFSIGRSTTGDLAADEMPVQNVRRSARLALRRVRANDPSPDCAPNTTGRVTGFLLRSQAVAGWPNLRVQGFSDIGATQPVCKARQTTLSSDVLLCVFDGVVQAVYLHEPPEQLHLGVEGSAGVYRTTLREVNAPNPGQQYGSNPKVTPTVCDPDGKRAVACVSARSDQQTLQIAGAASTIYNRLVNDFGQSFKNGFTSAEFALEMTKGVVEIIYQKNES